VDMPRACVIKCSRFVKKIFAAEQLVCLFGIRTAFLPIDTNESQLYLTEVITSGTVSACSC